MKLSLVMTPKLVRLRLLATNCELCSPSTIPEKLNYEMKHEVSFHPHPEEEGEGFAITANTSLIGNSVDEKQVLSLSCKFLAEYTYAGQKIPSKEFEPATEYYAHQIYIGVRAHLVNILTEMGVNGTFIPHSLKAAPSPEKGKPTVKKK